MRNFIKKFKLKRRAISVLAGMHFYGNPSKKMKVIGVTGTNGKTTTTTLLYKVATALGYRSGLISTVENIIIDQVRPATHTTPSPIDLNNLLQEMADKGCEYVFMEVSSHAMDQARVAGVTFAGGIFTNLTQDHLDYHKTMENYFLAKKKFFKMLPKTAFALSNADNEYGKRMIDGIAAKRQLYGFEKGADFEGAIERLDFKGLALDFNGEKISSKLLGKFNAYNLLSVWAASSLLGWDIEKVNAILENIDPPRGRFEYYVSEGGVIVVVDYAHTPDALEKIIEAVGEVQGADSKLITIVGCGGDRDATKRPIMGRIAATRSDVAIFTSDNPRSENPNRIIDEMKADLTNTDMLKVITLVDRREAIRKAITLAHKGTVIICAGKGHETYQEVAGVKNHFDDIEEFRKVLV